MENNKYDHKYDVRKMTIMIVMFHGNGVLKESGHLYNIYYLIIFNPLFFSPEKKFKPSPSSFSPLPFTSIKEV